MKRKFSILLVIMGTVGVLSTIVSTAIDNPETPLLSALGTFKYFTVQSNIIVIIYFWLLFSLKLNQNKLFNKLLGGVTVYITITFMVFVILLQAAWHPTGLGMFGNILNHYIVPITTIGYLIYFKGDYKFYFKDILIWIIYPISYVIFLLIFGTITGDYIYPFFNINELGFLSFFIAFIGIFILFFILACTAVFITNKKNKVQKI